MAPGATRRWRGADRRRWIALVVVCFAMLMNSLDQTIVNVALPTIQRNLHFSQSGLAWVIDAYLITFGGALLLAGRLGDLVGRKKIFIVGVVIFTVASGVCGIADNQALMVAARFVQGLGAALSSSVILAIIVAEFTDVTERAHAMSAYVFVAVGGGAVGLLLGGALTQWLSWHWIFFINLPIGVVTLALGARLIDENKGLGVRKGLDIVGTVVSTAGLTLAIYAIVTASDYGWASWHTLGSSAIALGLLVAFALWERRVRNPLMPLGILRARGMVSANFARGFTVIGMFSTFFIGSLYLQQVQGYSTLGTGLAFLPMSLIVLGFSLGPTARLMGLIGPKITASIGLVFLLVGLVLFAQSGVHTSYVPLILVAFMLIGLGAGILFTPLITIAVAEVRTHDAGLASGVVNVAQQFAAALGVAILSTVSASRTASLQALGHSTTEALMGGYHLAFAVAAASVLVALVLTLGVLRSPKGPAPELAEEEALVRPARAGADQAPSGVVQ